MVKQRGTEYDAIIVGGSFAGLAVASQLRGKVLLIERNEIGAHQTSACGTLFGVPERLGLLDTVLQVHHRLLFHTASRTIAFDVSEAPFCTFDYRAFCRGMVSAIEAEILQAKVLGLEGEEVVTDAGRFHAPILIDASGWRAVLASSLRSDFVPRERMSYGIETIAPRRGDGLCFWYDPNLLPKGVAWFFPIGGAARIGVASYAGDGHLKAHLELFLETQGLHKAEVHGGYFPAGLREPTVDRIFLVGDAAGQCLPLTGEGIRPALYFGQRLGTIVQRIINGEIVLGEGLKEYRAFVARHRGLFHLLGFFQRLILAVPTSVADRLIALTCREPFRSSILRGYVAFADPRALKPLEPKAGVGGPLGPYAGVAT